MLSVYRKEFSLYIMFVIVRFTRRINQSGGGPEGNRIEIEGTSRLFLYVNCLNMNAIHYN